MILYGTSNSSRFAFFAFSIQTTTTTTTSQITKLISLSLFLRICTSLINASRDLATFSSFLRNDDFVSFGFSVRYSTNTQNNITLQTKFKEYNLRDFFLRSSSTYQTPSTTAPTIIPIAAPRGTPGTRSNAIETRTNFNNIK